MINRYKRAISSGINAFSQFYDKDVKLIKETKTGITTITTSVTVIAEFKADVQDYNGGLAQEEYGLTVECQKRMYCNDNECLKEGIHADIDNKRYLIQYVKRTDLGVSVLLKEVQNGD